MSVSPVVSPGGSDDAKAVDKGPVTTPAVDVSRLQRKRRAPSTSPTPSTSA